MTTAIVLPSAVAPHEDFLERLEDWLENLFSEADSLYNHLSDEEKAAAVWGSGVISCINTYIDKAPADVINLLQTAFPTLSVDNVHGFLDEVLNSINTIQGEVPLTLEDAIAAMQAYLKLHQGSFWATISGAAATLISTLMSPETAVEKFISIGVTLYQTIIRPHVTATAATIDSASTDVTDPNKPVEVPAPSAAPSSDPDMDISKEAAAKLGGGEPAATVDETTTDAGTAAPEAATDTVESAQVLDGTPKVEGGTPANNVANPSEETPAQMSYEDAVKAEAAKDNPSAGEEQEQQ